MKQIFTAVVLGLLVLWELPQNIAGAITWLCYRRRRKVQGVQAARLCLFIETGFTGVSLGRFVFWTRVSNRFAHLEHDCRMHEYGHSLQSALLGPLYLLLIGLPSLGRVYYARYYFRKHGKSWTNYYQGYPERWADRLGGVV